MIRLIDDALNRITMYRLVVYYLVAILAVATALGAAGILPYDPTAIGFSTVLCLAVSWATNRIFAAVYRVPPNAESVYITALILVLILTPVHATDPAALGAFIFASVWATASKFVIAFRGKHVFNPAALGAVMAALLLDQPASWWAAGNVPLFPVVLIGGLLVVRKLQRFDLILAFIVADVATLAATTAPFDYLSAATQTFLYSPLLFAAFVLLTEPLTTPPTRGMRILYGAVVGIVAAPNVHVGPVYFTPEIAILVGNVFAFIVSPKGRQMLTLVGIEEAARGVYDFIFEGDRPLAFAPGQYMEWTLGFRSRDSRGNRRYFTLASAPESDDIRLGIKFYPASSAFKRAMAAMKPGDEIFAAQLAGDFVLPKDPGAKLAFLAGGIGVTPFRSMIEHLLATGERRDIVLLYANEKTADIAYHDLFSQAAAEIGLKTVYSVAAERVLGRGMHYGLIDLKHIQTEIPDYRERIFYISGPRAMVTAFQRTLRQAGVKHSRIKVDFFPGFA